MINGEGKAHTGISFNFPSGNLKSLQAAAPSGTSSITLEISAPDMEQMTESISVTEGAQPTIELDIPAGSDRKFSARASDAQGNLLYEGEATSILLRV